MKHSRWRTLARQAALETEFVVLEQASAAQMNLKKIFQWIKEKNIFCREK